MKIIKLFILLFAANFVLSAEASSTAKITTAKVKSSEAQKSLRLETVFGPMILDHPALIDVHNHRIIQRLKGIDQLGSTKYFLKLKGFSRYEHSVGVLYLLKKAGVSVKEQIAGLTHDASHTVFSHVADRLFDQEGYQDHIHDSYLLKSGVGSVLKKHGLKINDILPDQPAFKALENDLPDMCADRIQYNLNKALSFDLISTADVQRILENLTFKNGKWFFTDPKIAYEFAKLSLYFTEHVYGSAENIAIYTWTVNMLKRAMAIGLVKHDEIHFGEDIAVLNKLYASADPYIQEQIKKCENAKSYYKLVSTTEKFDLHGKTKFRGIDPLVYKNGEFLRLTCIDAKFAAEYNQVKEFCKKGLYIAFI
jgi:HD superfamily phosphohydrolase